MTTTVPYIYAFHEFSGVAAAVADHIVAAQNAALAAGMSSNASTTTLNGLKQDTSTGPTPVRSRAASVTDTEAAVAAASDAAVGRRPSVTKTAHHRSGSASSSSSTTAAAGGPSGGPSGGKEDRKFPAAAKKAAQRRFKIAISGGSLISVLHEGLLARPDVQWSKWDVYFADERLVPFDDPESNYGKAKRQIFDRIPADQMPRIFHIDESLINDPQEAADQYEKTLIKGFAAKDSVKLPLFDLILLGCAPDGHICSLFPSHPALREKFAWVVPIEDAPTGPKNRITLTIPVISHAHRVTFVVEGAVKAPVVKTIMERPEKGLPSSIVNENAAGKVSWFVDDEALTDVFVTKKKYKFLVPLESDKDSSKD